MNGFIGKSPIQLLVIGEYISGIFAGCSVNNAKAALFHECNLVHLVNSVYIVYHNKSSDAISPLGWRLLQSRGTLSRNDRWQGM